MQRPFAWFALAAAGAAIVGSISPWATVVSVFGQVSFEGTHYPGGKIALVLAVVVVIEAAINLGCAQGSAWTKRCGIGLMVDFALLAVIAIHDWQDLSHRLAALHETTPVDSVGWGIQLLALST